jgi:hypothetical protein
MASSSKIVAGGVQDPPSAVGSGRECVAEVTELAVMDCEHPDVLGRRDVRRGIVDEQALMDEGADPLRGKEVHAGIGFRVADPRGVHDGVGVPP